MRLTILLAAIITCLAHLTAIAGEFNEVLSIGQVAPAWEKLPGSDGNPHSTSELKEKQVLVVSFTCLSCPTAMDYEARFDALSKQYGGPDGKVGFVAICVNQIAPDRLDKLTQRAKQQKLSFPYLYDESQKIARDFGATFTPEYFVLDRDRKVVYMGALDDSTDAEKVTRRYVEEAINAALKGETPEVKETIGRGCRVRYARERK
ncbi:thioredoxin family protein [Schlesneria sp. DSM 10557]|uniref:thioredoxin family protein n=1 Tax=Schlesneria sp. DSM 10557 TaxID=3044399 RepID=UPI0035A0EC25